MCILVVVFLHTVFVYRTGLYYVNSLTCIVRYICSHATEEMTVAEEVVCFSQYHNHKRCDGINIVIIHTEMVLLSSTWLVVAVCSFIPFVP